MLNREKEIAELVTYQEKLLIITAPSGAGKTTLIQKLMKERCDIEFSTSTTTRTKRTNEIDGKDYYFVDKATFDYMISNGEFIEWASVHNNYYGTTIKELKRIVTLNKFCLLDVDVQGGMNLMKYFPKSKTIFIQPPSIDELEVRLRGRHTETEETIRIRLENARKEMEYIKYYRYKVINDEVERAFEELLSILDE